MKHLRFISLVSLAASVYAGAAGAQTSSASFIVVHGIPGRNVGAGIDPLLPVDVLVAGKYCLLQGFTFGSIAGPYDIPAGTYSLAVSLANPLSPCSNTAVISGNVTLNAGQFGAVVAALSTTGAPTAEVYTVNVAPIVPGRQRFMVAHAADAPAVAVKAVGLGKSPEKVGFKLQPGAERSFSVPAQPAFAVTAAAGATVIGPVDVALGDRDLAIIVAVGSAGTGSATLLTKVIPDVF